MSTTPSEPDAQPEPGTDRTQPRRRPWSAPQLIVATLAGGTEAKPFAAAELSSSASHLGPS
jgi:hypothetical protein